MRVLGIESSCDETGVAIFDTEQGLLGQALYSQIDMHAAYGGVVPELASRDHVRRLLPLVRQVMSEAGTTPEQLDGVAFTAGPGLAGALLVGAGVGRSLAYGWGLPAVPVHTQRRRLRRARQTFGMVDPRNRMHLRAGRQKPLLRGTKRMQWTYTQPRKHRTWVRSRPPIHPRRMAAFLLAC